MSCKAGKHAFDGCLCATDESSEIESLRASLAEALDRCDRAQAAMLEEANARIAAEDKEYTARTSLVEAVAYLDGALRTINAIATSAGYAYRAPNSARTAALDDIRLTAGSFKGQQGHDAEDFLARLDKDGAR